MSNIYKLFLGSILLINSCTINPNRKYQTEAKKVFEKLIPLLIESNHVYSNKNTVIFIDSTAIVPTAVGSYKDVKGIIESDIFDKKKKLRLIENLIKNGIDRKFMPVVDYKFDTNLIFIPNKNWKGNFKNTLGAILVSIVSFDRDYNSGVFYYNWVCPGDCGSDYFVFIKKKKDLWIIEDLISVSVS